MKTISTGERIEFPLVRGMPERAKTDTLLVLHAGLVPAGTADKKEVLYLFAFGDKNPTPPKSVTVEDVSEDHTIPLVEDMAPTYTKQIWTGKSRVFKVDESALNWLTYLDDSMRVFRLTITSADGKKTVLHQAWMVPAPMKAAMRSVLEVK